MRDGNDKIHSIALWSAEIMEINAIDIFYIENK